MAATVISKIPCDYADRFGDYEPTEKDLEMLDAEISKRLPQDVSWCGDILLAEIEPGETAEETRSRFNIDIEAILGEAYEDVFERI